MCRKSRSPFIIGATLSIIFCLQFPSLQAQNDKAKAIKSYLSDNFGIKGYETPWYGSIKAVTVQGLTVIVDTDLVGANDKATGICAGVSGYVFSNENRSLGLQNVEVRSSRGGVLIKRMGPSGKCY